MNIYQNGLYLNDIKNIDNLDIHWNKLAGKSILISGARGMIGSCLIDVIMRKNMTEGLDCKIYALGRNVEAAKIRFAYCYDMPEFAFISGDISKPLEQDLGKVDFVLHLASNTHPALYSGDPIGTITTNILGQLNLLEYAVKHGTQRFLFASSVEIYGENRGDVEKFDENYLGYIDSNSLRAGYPESKRCGEALCQAYKRKYELDIVIPRFSRVYGPSMLMNDTKALSQFILRAAAGENIILKSTGNQFYSYAYVADAVSGLITVLLRGKNGEAYNVSDEKSDVTLKELAEICANIAGTEVEFNIPDANESVGYSHATVARLDNRKLKALGWSAQTDIKSGLLKTIKILRENLN